MTVDPVNNHCAINRHLERVMIYKIAIVSRHFFDDCVDKVIIQVIDGSVIEEDLRSHAILLVSKSLEFLACTIVLVHVLVGVVARAGALTFLPQAASVVDVTSLGALAGTGIGFESSHIITTSAFADLDVLAPGHAR